MNAPQTSAARRADRLMFVVVALALLAPIGYLLFLAMSGADLVDVVQTAGPTNFTGERYEALPWLAVATVAAITALGTWWIDRRRAGAAAAAIAEQQRLAAELEHVAAEVERLEGDATGCGERSRSGGQNLSASRDSERVSRRRTRSSASGTARCASR